MRGNVPLKNCVALYLMDPLYNFYGIVFDFMAISWEKKLLKMDLSKENDYKEVLAGHRGQ